uniref:Ovule protein n=1 Tax=Parascaris univalens TaxID=6257 RepID=A0A915AQG4_PARUN
MISILHSRYHRQQQVDLFMYSEAEVSIIFQWELNSWKPYLKEMQFCIVCLMELLTKLRTSLFFHTTITCLFQ